jgi:hypothetical protein
MDFSRSVMQDLSHQSEVNHVEGRVASIEVRLQAVARIR